MKNKILFTTGLDMLLSIKIGITYITSHNFAKIKVDSYNSLRLEKAITCNNDILLINKYLLRNKLFHTYTTPMQYLFNFLYKI